jgi:hypothetical protein
MIRAALRLLGQGLALLLALAVAFMISTLIQAATMPLDASLF